MASYLRGNISGQNFEVETSNNNFFLTYTYFNNPFNTGRINFKQELIYVKLLELQTKSSYGCIIYCLLGILGLIIFYHFPFMIIVCLYLYMAFRKEKSDAKSNSDLTVVVACQLEEGKKCILKVNGDQYTRLKEYARIKAAVTAVKYETSNETDLEKTAKSYRLLKPDLTASITTCKLAKPNLVEELKKLIVLHENNLLTEEEFYTKKELLLANI